MSSWVEIAQPRADQVQPAPERDWAAHCQALQMPELRSALEDLHSCLEVFFNDPEQS